MKMIFFEMMTKSFICCKVLKQNKSLSKMFLTKQNSPEKRPDLSVEISTDISVEISLAISSSF